MDNTRKTKPLEPASAVLETNVQPPKRTLPGSLKIEIKEVDVSRPARAVNRMWPNR